MKKLIVLFTVLLFTISAIAQSPDSFKYQAVLRDEKGQIMANENVAVEIAILQGSATGTTVFTETHHVTTSQQGIINLDIGSVEDMSSVDWSGNSHFVEIKVNGKLMGTSQLMSVPYAMHAKTAETITALQNTKISMDGTTLNININGYTTGIDLKEMITAEIQRNINESLNKLAVTDNQLSIGDGPVVDMKPYLDNTDSQTLLLAGNSLIISGGNSIDLPVDKTQDADADPQNEIQYLSRNKHELSLSGTNETIDLSGYMDNTDKQSLSIEENKLSISNGNTVDLPVHIPELQLEGRTLGIKGSNSVLLPIDAVNDPDADPLNEIQHLQFNNKKLCLSGSDETVDFNQFLTKSDHQKLSINGRIIEISEGNSIELPVDSVNDADADSTNEIQSLVFDGQSLQISKGNTVDLSLIKTADGKGLSTEDYTTAEKAKLAGVDDNAEENVNADWQAFQGDAQILNKPSTLNGYGITDSYTKKRIDKLLASKVNTVNGKGLSTEDYTTAEKTKLAGIEDGAEANVNADWNAISGDAEILNKPNSLSGYGITDAYTQTQADFLFSGKVDKITGRGLSAENFTAAEKTKLALIAESAEVNVNADWTATSGDAEILNKPDLPDIYNTTDEKTIQLNTNDGTSSVTILNRSGRELLKVDGTGRITGDGSGLSNVKPLINFAGGNMHRQIVSNYGSYDNVKRVSLTVPASGKCIVTASGYLRWESTGWDLALLGIGMDGDPNDTWADEYDWWNHLNIVTDYNCTDSSDQYTSFTNHRGFNVGPGTHTFTLWVNKYSSYSKVKIGDVNISVMYAPTAGTGKKRGSNAANAEAIKPEGILRQDINPDRPDGEW